ncbi:MAG: hypothetical protein Q3M30_19830 [Candidatus Electrothrix sp. Rat3]|nr:hypothetical protein [Candidatus Electrothrix rattekaaiensis]
MKVAIIIDNACIACKQQVSEVNSVGTAKVLALDLPLFQEKIEVAAESE